MYVLKKKRYRLCAAILDSIGKAIFFPISMLRRNGLPSKVKNILIIRLDHVGDAIFTTPSLRVLRRRFPEARITLLSSTWGKDVVRGNHNVDEVLTLGANWFARGDASKFCLWEIVMLILKLRKKRYDIGIDPRGDFRNILLMFFSRVKYRIGYGITGGGFLLSREIPYIQNVHEVEHSLEIVRSLGCDLKDTRLEICYSDEDRELIEKMLAKRGISQDEQIACIHVGAGYSSKLWSMERYAELIDELHQRYGFRTVLIGTQSERPMIDKVVSLAVNRPVEIVGETTINELAALLKRSSIFIGSDSGPAHIAAAMEAKSVVLFSSANNVRQWGPWGGTSIVIKKDVECSLCEITLCPREDHICMMSISVEEVLEKVDELMSGASGGEGEPKHCEVGI